MNGKGDNLFPGTSPPCLLPFQVACSGLAASDGGGELVASALSRFPSFRDMARPGASASYFILCYKLKQAKKIYGKVNKPNLYVTSLAGLCPTFQPLQTALPVNDPKAKWV